MLERDGRGQDLAGRKTASKGPELGKRRARDQEISVRGIEI